MKVCKNCFSDNEIIAFLTTHSTAVGRCDFCGSTDEDLMDIEELYDFFKEFFNNFQTTTKGESFIELVQRHWNIFRTNEIGIGIVDFIVNQLDTNIHSAFELVNFIPDILENVHYWDILKEKIKWERRYVIDINYLTEDLGWDKLLSSNSTLDNSEKFYRARLHHSENLHPYATNEMYGPTPEKATAGRANPTGIPFLYLCDNKETVLYEIRASYLDELSIGTFVLNKFINKEIVIADFTEKPSVFFQGDEIKNEVSNKIKAKLLKDLISNDLSKPMRRYDTEIDYIPTQFICEFIKVFSGVHGIKFRSSLHTEGNNIVIFDQNIMVCESVENVKVSNVSISV